MTTKSTFQLIKENWVIVATCVSLIAGYVTLSNKVGQHEAKIARLELRDEVKGTEINDLKLMVRELQVILQRIDRRTEVLDGISKLQLN